MIYEELNKFNEITFFEDTHQYYFRDKECISVTKLIHNYIKPFEKEKVAFFYAKKHGLDQYDVMAEWDQKNFISRERGSEFHKYAELKLAGKHYNYDPNKVSDKLILMFDTFYNKSKDSLIPIRSELVVGDYNLGLCGMVDQIYFNKKSGNIEIWDWKTNSKIRTESEYNTKMLHGLKHLHECEMNTYSLQLLTYKHIIEKNTGLKIGDCYINWFNEENPSFQIKKVLPLEKEVSLILSA